MSIEDIFQMIRSVGGRVSKIRTEIIKLLFEAECLVSQANIMIGLRKRHINPNRSTIFRELNFLFRNCLVVKNTILGIDYYEIPKDHHHHLVCVKCNEIHKINIGNHLDSEEKKLSKDNNFKVINHTLDFYGICGECQKIITK